MIIDRRIDFTQLKSPKNNIITFENSITDLIHSKSTLTLNFNGKMIYGRLVHFNIIKINS
jgi:hypothetical protein